MKTQILIIEDCEMMQRFLKNFLKKNFEITIAPDRKTAENILYNSDYQSDIILMDVNLPDGNGLDFINEIKLNPHFFKTAVMAFSGEKDMNIRWQALESGADDFMSKPFLPKELDVRLKKLVKPVRTSNFGWSNNVIPEEVAIQFAI